ncbi:MAG: MBL fold metallo-hydrolase [Clostridia bacterium]|nr:MBL fold metallo-hydrolase [Clostridia bacterium]
MRADILFSGSSGNCTLIRNNNTNILIDCGKSARTISTSLRSLGTELCEIDAIFITHEHTDHTSALGVILSKYHIPVHMTEPSAKKLESERGAMTGLTIHPVEYSVKVGSLEITSFPLPHDSAAHVGYIIADEDGDRLGIATDMGHVTDDAISNLSVCRRVIIEANHDVGMLMTGRYPEFLKKRIFSPRGHLPNEDAAALACRLASAGVEVFALAHLSEENNLPSAAYSKVRSALDEAGFADRQIIVADRREPVSLPDGAVPEKNQELLCLK